MQASFRYLPLVLLAVAWEAVARLNLVDSSALPPLSKVGLAWVDLIRDGELVNNGAASLYRGSVGLLLAVLGGGGLGIAWRGGGRSMCSSIRSSNCSIRCRNPRSFR